MRPGKIIILVPALFGKADVVGGQVTAARGLLSYLATRSVSHRIVDTAHLSDARRVTTRILGKIWVFIRSIYFALFFSFDAALFFKSTNLGLFERFFPAALFRLRGARVGLFFRNSDILNLPERGIEQWVIVSLLKPYSVYFVQGEAWKRRLVKMGFASSQIFVIPNWLPADFSVFSEGKPVPKSPIRFVFSGRIVKEKGVFDILHALASESLKGKCEFVFAGDGPDFSACRELVRQFGLEGVHFKGALSKALVSDLLQNSDVFVMPTWHPEGFPNSILEAMATGLPVITTDVGAICESVFDGVNGFIVSKESTDDLISKMKAYIDQPSLIQNHSKASLEVTLQRHDRARNIELLLSRLG